MAKKKTRIKRKFSKDITSRYGYHEYDEKEYNGNYMRYLYEIGVLYKDKIRREG